MVFFMKLLLISYGSLESDGRLLNLISVFEQMGELTTFTRGKKPLRKHSIICNSFYPLFIIRAVNYARKLGKIDVLVLDDRKATIPGLLIRLLNLTKFIIQDCRELYLFDEVKHFIGKAGCIFEKLMIQRADIVICANRERAEIMKNRFSLLNSPLVYSNIRKLAYTTEEEKTKAQQKFAALLRQNEYRVIASSGCDLNRGNEVLVKNFKNVNKKCRLLLAGSNNPEEEKYIKALSALDSKNEVTILGLLSHAELKYLISQSHVGIVSYGQADTNNKYCASGKLYEFLYEGIPLVTTSNPPLRRICDEEKVGVVDDRFADGINEVLRNYSFYKEKVKTYIERVSVEENNRKLVSEIKDILGKLN